MNHASAIATDTLDLTTIANQSGTDKGTIKGAGHAYTMVYDLLFCHLRDRPINLLEIGLAAGGPEVDGSADRSVLDVPSVRMWHEYFPKARIYGLDISDFSKFQTDWFKFFRADCGDESQLRQVVDSGVGFDIIIDDGSHASYHQQLTLKALFPTLRTNGFYAIEDLNWQPTTYERTLPPAKPTTEYLLEDFGEPVVMFTDDQLATMRHSFNRTRKLSAPQPHYVDHATPRGYVRRVGEAALGRVMSRVKLALIRKA
jgi:hypothetical protein